MILFGWVLFRCNPESVGLCNSENEGGVLSLITKNKGNALSLSTKHEGDTLSPSTTKEEYVLYLVDEMFAISDYSS